MRSVFQWLDKEMEFKKSHFQMSLSGGENHEFLIKVVILLVLG